MSPQPQRDTTAGRIYNDLRNLARRQGQPTDELFQLYLLERFLFRLAHSPLDRLFVLKGGTLLAAYQLRRPTEAYDRRWRSERDDRAMQTHGAWLGRHDTLPGCGQEGRGSLAEGGDNRRQDGTAGTMSVCPKSSPLNSSGSAWTRASA